MGTPVNHPRGSLHDGAGLERRHAIVWSGLKGGGGAIAFLVR